MNQRWECNKKIDSINNNKSSITNACKNSGSGSLNNINKHKNIVNANNTLLTNTVYVPRLADWALVKKAFENSKLKILI